MHLGLCFLMGGALLAAACVEDSVKPASPDESLPTLTTPAAGGADWFEGLTEHFIVRGNIGREKVAEISRRLEWQHHALSVALFRGRAPPTAMVQVIVLATKSEYEYVVGRNSAGKYLASLPNDLEPIGTIITYDEAPEAANEILKHELTHRFIHATLGETPTWLDEGLAEYYEGLEIRADRLVIGRASFAKLLVEDDAWPTLTDEEREYYVPYSALKAPSQLLEMSPSEFYLRGRGDEQSLDWRKSTHYASAFALVHLLASEKGEYNRRLIRILRPGARWKDASVEVDKEFASLPQPAFDQAFAAYVRRKQFLLREILYEPPVPASAAVRKLSVAEASLMAARLLPLYRRECPSSLFLNEARIAAPSSPEVKYWTALFHLYRQQGDDAASILSELVGSEPHNPRYLHASLEVLDRASTTLDPDERDARIADLLKALDEHAENSAQLSGLARAYLGRGAFEAALAAAKRGMDRDSSCWSCFSVPAAASFQLHETDDAVYYQGIAISRLPAGAKSQTLRAQEQWLEEYRKAAEQERR